ncbi:DUF5362 family protein [Prosthecobacter sp.]|uniref:DUF5362 family protein n=1 Tax=Prosthecobacter sp. TaxID=1965333 RepID=UPI00378409BF
METPANPYSAPGANLYGSPGGTSDAVATSTIAALAGTKPWVRFLSVLMWIGVVFMLLGALALGAMSMMGLAKQSSSAANPLGGAQFMVLAVLYGVMSFVYIYPALKLWKYANRIGSLVSTRTVADLDSALNEQRSFWKFIGIMTILLLSLYLIIIIGAVALGATAAMKANGIH